MYQFKAFLSAIIYLKSDDMKVNAISVRAANTEDKDFKKFIKD